MTPVLPRELLQALANAGNDIDRASDVIEEYIIHRRQKGDTLFDVSNSLLLLENRVSRARRRRASSSSSSSSHRTRTRQA